MTWGVSSQRDRGIRDEGASDQSVNLSLVSNEGNGASIKVLSDILQAQKSWVRFYNAGFLFYQTMIPCGWKSSVDITQFSDHEFPF